MRLLAMPGHWSVSLTAIHHWPDLAGIITPGHDSHRAHLRQRSGIVETNSFISIFQRDDVIAEAVTLS